MDGVDDKLPHGAALAVSEAVVSPGRDEACARGGQTSAAWEPCPVAPADPVPVVFLSNLLFKGTIFFGTVVLKLRVGKEPPGILFLHTVGPAPGIPTRLVGRNAPRESACLSVTPALPLQLWGPLFGNHCRPPDRD